MKNEWGGIYILVRDGKVLYVGRSSNLERRLDSHHYGFGADVYCIQATNLKRTEHHFINKYKPLYNGNYDRNKQFITEAELDDLLK